MKLTQKSQVKSPIKLSPQNAEPLLNSSRLNHTTKSHNPIQKPKQILSQPIQLEYQPHKGGKNIIPTCSSKKMPCASPKLRWKLTWKIESKNPGQKSFQEMMDEFFSIFGVYFNTMNSPFFHLQFKPLPKKCGGQWHSSRRGSPLAKVPTFSTLDRFKGQLSNVWDTYGKYRHKPWNKNTNFRM